MKTLNTLLIITALIAGTISCAPTQHNITISSIAGGSVTNPGEGTFTYDAGAAVDLLAEAEEGYQFVNWTSDVDNTGNANDATTTITINGDYSITANFAVIPPAQYDLTISSTVGGEVTAPGELIFNYDEGADVDLVAEAEEGYHFVNWTGDVDTIANVNAATTVISMHGDYAITTNFAPDWPLFGGIIAAVVVAAGLAIFFVRRRRAARTERQGRKRAARKKH